MPTDLESLGETLRSLLGAAWPPWTRISTTQDVLTVALRGDLKVRFRPHGEGYLATWFTTFPLEELESGDDAAAPRIRSTVEAALAHLGLEAGVELHQRRLDFGWVPVVVATSQPSLFGPEEREAMAAFVLGAERWREAIVGTVTHEALLRWQ